MDWIHCNACFNTPDNENCGNLPFFMTNCGHIFCGRCTDGSSQKCLVHDNSCNFHSLSDVQREHAEFFLPISQIVAKILRTIEFQCNQYASLLFYLKPKLERYKAQKEQIASLRSKCKRHLDEKNSIKNDLIKALEENRVLKSKLDSLKRPQNFQFNMYPEKRAANQGSSAGTGFLFGAAAAASGQLSFSPLTQHLNNSQTFTSPSPIQFPKIYRESNICKVPSTPQKKSSLSLSPSSENTQRTASRRVLLPGDRASSPMDRLRLQNLHLKCTPSIDRTRINQRSHLGHAPRIGLGNATSNKYF